MAVQLASGIATRFLNNQRPTVQPVGSAAAKSGSASALTSMSNVRSTPVRGSSAPDLKTPFENRMQVTTDMRNSIKGRQQVAAQKKAQEDLLAQLAESERLRIADQTKYTDNLVNFTNKNYQSQQQKQGQTYNYNGSVSSARQNVVNSAMSLLGTPYAWGGGGIGNRGSRGIGMGTQNVIGVDCSGLTSYAYGTIGINLPRHSRTQLNSGGGVKVNISRAKPGDLIGWSDGRGHVGIYLGNGKMIHSPRPGSRVQIVNIYDTNLIYAVSFLGA